MPNTTAIVVDDANRIRSATVGADTETYTYDGLGRRTRVTTSVGPLMQFYSQAGQPLLWEIPGNEVKTREYTIYLGPQRIARRMTSSLTYLHTDHLGSPLAETTQTPVTLVSSNPHWEPYGAPAGGAFWGGLQFTGHYQDRVTRLTYMQQRDYDPYAGHFLAVDPVAASPGSFNRYWYASNNPYGYNDPDGRVPVAIAGCAAAPACAGAVLAGVGAAIGLSASGSSQGTPPLLPAAILGPSIIAGVMDVVQNSESGEVGPHAPGEVPDAGVIVRGGQGAMPEPGKTFSGSQGGTLEEAAAGVPHGTIKSSTAGEIRTGGGSVEVAPELTRSGNINGSHVNVTEGAGASSFGPPQPNPVPKQDRIK